MHEDAELLLRYVVDHSETAFTELVRRHADMVYSAALRLAGGDAQHAEDVTQRVFTELARQAKRLTRHPTLAGWHAGGPGARQTPSSTCPPRRHLDSDGTGFGALGQRRHRGAASLGGDARFTSPVDDATLQRYQMLKTGNVSDMRLAEMVIAEKAPVDDQYDSLFRIGLNGFGSQGGGKNNRTATMTMEAKGVSQ